MPLACAKALLFSLVLCKILEISTKIEMIYLVKSAQIQKALQHHISEDWSISDQPLHRYDTIPTLLSYTSSKSLPVW